MAKTLIVKGKVKEIIGRVCLGSGFVEKLETKVKEIIAEAVIRANENNRHTIMPKDI